MKQSLAAVGLVVCLVLAGCGARSVSLGRMYGLPVSERKDGGSIKSFPLDDGYEWPRKPSDGRPSKDGGGKKVWNIANRAPASPSGGTTKG